MNVIVTTNEEAAYEKAAQIILSQIRNKPDSRLGLSTGSTAEAIYKYLVRAYENGQADFSLVSTVNLDEYIGIAADNPQSYHSSMNHWLFDLVNIKKSNTVVPSGEGDSAEACKNFEKQLIEGGRIDLQLLGLGISGHIGFNEPGEYLRAGVHIQKLHPSTLYANSRFFRSRADVPKTAITMGIGDIFRARHILLVATGNNKADAMRSLLCDDKISTRCPVTMLKAHNNTTVIIDERLSQTLTPTSF